MPSVRISFARIGWKRHSPAAAGPGEWQRARVGPWLLGSVTRRVMAGRGCSADPLHPAPGRLHLGAPFAWVCTNRGASGRGWGGWRWGDKPRGHWNSRRTGGRGRCGGEGRCPRIFENPSCERGVRLPRVTGEGRTRPSEVEVKGGGWWPLQR